MALPGAEQRLELTQADMLDYGSLVEVVMGCDGVFHTSSPSDLVSNYPVSTRKFLAFFVLCCSSDLFQFLVIKLLGASFSSLVLIY